MSNGKIPLLLTFLAAGVFLAVLLLAQPYTADWPGRAFAKPAKHYVQAALRQDSLELAHLSANDSPVRWALAAARTQRRSLAQWTGRTQALTGARWGDTTEVFLYPSGDTCSDAPIHFRFLGEGSNARVVSASSSCLAR